MLFAKDSLDPFRAPEQDAAVADSPLGRQWVLGVTQTSGKAREMMQRGLIVLLALVGSMAWSSSAGATTTTTEKYWGTADGGVFGVPSPTEASLGGTVTQVATRHAPGTR